MVLFQAALIQTEGDSLLCGGITLMTHFKEQRAYTKPREVSRNLKFVTNNTTNVCFEFWRKNFDIGAQIGGST